MKKIPNIGHPVDLKPQTRMFEGHDDTFINADGMIALARKIDTPQAKAIYKAFRKRHAEICIAHPDMPAAKRREKAILAAMADEGWKVNIVPAPGGVA